MIATLLRPKLLVVNPNTSEYITHDLRERIEKLDYPDVDFHYYTSTSGPSILASTSDLEASTAHTLQPVLDLVDEGGYDGVLVACYADHPLTALLQRHLEQRPAPAPALAGALAGGGRHKGKQARAVPVPVPVVGIFEASVEAALDILGESSGGGRGGGRFGIITTGYFYEAQLAQGVHRMLGPERATRGKGFLDCGDAGSAEFAGVASTGISPERLEAESTLMIRRRVEQATRRLVGAMVNANAAAGAAELEVMVICMGGVILAGMEPWVRVAACEAEAAAAALALGGERTGRVVVVDQLKAGVERLLGQVLGARDTEYEYGSGGDHKYLYMTPRSGNEASAFCRL